jgi:hypothetical protein
MLTRDKAHTQQHSDTCFSGRTVERAWRMRKIKDYFRSETRAIIREIIQFLKRIQIDMINFHLIEGLENKLVLHLQDSLFC